MKALRVVAGVLGALGVLAGVAWIGWSLLNEAPDIPTGAVHPVQVTVESGDRFSRVAKRLEDAGLVVSATRLRILARMSGAHTRVRAGTYQLVPGASPRQILADLVSGRVQLLRVTIPEGKRLDQIAAEVERVLAVPVDDFLAAASDAALRAELSVPTDDLEGYLFPDTYFFPVGVSASEVVRAAVARFHAVWDSLEVPVRDGFDRHQIVTLASIVEAETRLPEEKPRVAAVYLNRLGLGWKLQADPTVRYGLDRFAGRLYYRHLEVDTPYNTYLHGGLPPGPIGAPGRESLLAVLAPTEPCHDLFFVASGDGGHIFSRTGEEHVRAKLGARRSTSRRPVSQPAVSDTLMDDEEIFDDLLEPEDLPAPEDLPEPEGSR